MSITPLSAATLDRRFARELPEMAVSWQAEPAPQARLLALDETLAAELGLDPAELRGPGGVGMLVGNTLPAGATPVAQAYAGHQFGGYSPRLGDGRRRARVEMAMIIPRQYRQPRYPLTIQLHCSWKVRAEARQVLPWAACRGG